MERKRILSFAMALVMCICMLGLTAYATATDPAPVCTCADKCAEGDVNSECAVCSADDVDLSACTGKEPNIAPVCNCTDKCTEATINLDCPVCSADGADLSACTGKEPNIAPVCNCTDKCTEATINLDCPVCSADGADLSACQGVPAMAPLAEGDALCSYTSTNGSVTGSNATINEAVAALNDAGGGTITVTQSGKVAANIIVTSEITILAQEGNSVTVTPEFTSDWNSALFKFDVNKETTHRGSLTFGKDGMSDGLLTFSGGNQSDVNSTLVSYETFVSYGDAVLRKVALHDGVSITGFTTSVLTGNGLISFQMDGGKIHENNTTATLISVAEFEMTGGEIYKNTSTTGNLVIVYDSSEDRNATRIAGGAKIYQNSVSQWKYLIDSDMPIEMGENAEIYECTSPAVIYSKSNVTMSGSATVVRCTSLSSNYGIIYTEGSVTMEGDACIGNNEGLANAAAIYTTASVIMRDTAHIVNFKDSRYGAIYAEGSVSMLDNAYIDGCEGSTSGGIFADGSERPHGCNS